MYNRIHELLHYEPDTGIFAYKSPHARAGQDASHKMGKGYRSITVDGTDYYVHRLAFLWMTGMWPAYIDHIDCDRTNNIWGNLREALNGQNIHRAVHTANRTNLPPNVYRERGRYRVRVRKIHGGWFDSLEPAAEAAKALAQKVYGEFA